MSDAIFYGFFALVGACIGSFLNVCVARWPRDESVVSPRSHCPSCGHAIAWHENIPVLSWLWLRARCSGCREPISVVYPLLELVVAVLWLTAAVRFGITFTAVRLAVAGTILLGIMLTDAAHYIIPDGFTVFGLIFGIVTAAVGTVIGEVRPFVGVYDALIGACVGAGVVAIVGWLGEVALRKEAMGFGDVTLMAMLGTYLGPERTLLTLLLGAALGAVTFLTVVYPVAAMRRRAINGQLELSLGRPPFAPPHVPFGVFLAPAAVISLLWGDSLIAWYVSWAMRP